jgi:copper(I)-binding protein
MTTIARSHTRRGLAAAFAALLGQLSAAQVRAADYDLGAIHISETWARATPKGATAAAGYLTVTNNGTAPDRLSCASSDASTKCQIHNMTMENGVMKMRPLEGGLEIKPGETVTLKPASVPVMFLGLKQPLGRQERRSDPTIRHGRQSRGGISDRGNWGAGTRSGAGGGTMMQGGGGMMQMKPQH